jgi:hypothetical protein
MSRSAAQKRIHYVRAVYGQVKPKDTLEKVLRNILKAMPTAGHTEVEHPSLGTLSVRFRDTLSKHGLFVAIGQGVEGESMATMGLHVSTESDAERPVPPTDGRAFKLSDAFCLIDDDELLICTDGGLRVNSVASYLRSILAAGNATNESQTMDLVARLNQDKAEVLASGIKSMKIISSAYQASRMLKGQKGDDWLKKGVGNLLDFVRSAFEQSIEDDAERQSLIDRESDIVVSTEIKVSGGTNGEEVLLKALDELASDAILDVPEGAEILISAKAGQVSSFDVVLHRLKSIKRRQGQNGLDHADAWNKLAEYRSELIDQKLWKK